MRIDYEKLLPEANRAMSEFEKVVESSTLEPKLRELVKLRASQIHCCAHCVEMHTKDARAIGEDEQRLHLVAVWREAPSLTPREPTALDWTEALTLLPDSGAPDEVFEAMAREFDPAEQEPVGTYVSSRHPDAVVVR
jgi:AhpD family alkylhydroperoxidase